MRNFLGTMLTALMSGSSVAAQVVVDHWVNPNAPESREFSGGVAIDGGSVFIGTTATVGPSLISEFDLSGALLADYEPDPLGATSQVAQSIAVTDSYLVGGMPFSGLVSVLDRSTGEQVHLLSVGSGQNFGASVAVSGNRLLVGAPTNDLLGDDAGAAYLFDLDTGNQLFELTASNGSALDNFGWSVAIHGNYAVVGSPRFGVADKGAAYVFDVVTGAQLFSLTPFDHAAQDHFGTAVAINAHCAVVGTPGVQGQTQGTGTGAGDHEAVYVFDVQTGQQLQQILSPAPATTPDFGCALAIAGQRVVVGAPADNGFGDETAYLFDLPGGQLIAELALPAGFDNEFGRRIAIDADRVVCIAPDQYLAQDQPDGIAYLFDALLGQPTSSFGSPDGGENSAFGSSLAVAGSLAVVGAPKDNSQGPETGAAYVLDVQTGQAVYAFEGAEEGDRYGLDVAINSTFALVGAPLAAGFKGRIEWVDLSSGDVSVVEGTEPLAWLGQRVAMNETVALASVYDVSTSTSVVNVYTPGSEVPLIELRPSLAVPQGRVGPIAIDGSRVVMVRESSCAGFGAGSGGAFFIFDLATGTEIQSFETSFPSVFCDSEYGASAALSENRLAIGATAYGVNGEETGAVYVYEPSTGELLFFLTASDAYLFPGGFGSSVAIEAGLLLVGAEGRNTVYSYDLETGVELYRLDVSMSLPSPFPEFGASMQFEAGTLWVGAPGDDTDGANSGRVYIADVPTHDIPLSYCQATPSSAGCSALVSTSSPTTQPTSGSADYSVLAFGVQGLKNGFLLVGLDGAAAIPFSGGTLCIQPPIKRGPFQNSAGSGSTTCDGSFTETVNDGVLLPFGLDAGAGNSAWYQYWFRDPQNAVKPSTVSNAIALDFQ